MEPEIIKLKQQEIVAQYGEWTNHNIHLGNGVYTITDQGNGSENKVRRILQIIADTVNKPWEKLRVLDLACLEGLYGIELALQGAEVVGIEGRNANIAKANFAKDVLGLNNIQFVQDDVRNLSKAKYGSFDVVLCLGILYHLDLPDVFYFMETVAEVCENLAIADTHVSMNAEKCYLYKDQKYWGSSYVEHSFTATPEEKEKSLWASLDNQTSFWFTRYSLYNLLATVGFTSVYECHNPPVINYERKRLNQETDRNTFLAIKGKQVTLKVTAVENSLSTQKWPEKTELIHRKTGN
ncbi:class I SAM-dependent methyltransferase [Aerosakkonemataceae cyanobacterium BLCC-F154]|uniref:Class I SAM-dependent methyltransferase n=1 Tax=Floridaenema fluviatile BLCC-F154 TaxID=3153640 RepID=A0ABV4YE83_9CYAN